MDGITLALQVNILSADITRVSSFWAEVQRTVTVCSVRVITF